MKFVQKKQSGFTLMELLIVVAIIGVLAAVGLPLYNGYIADAKLKSTKENHSRVSATVASMITQANSGVTPSGFASTPANDPYPDAEDFEEYFKARGFVNPNDDSDAVEAVSSAGTKAGATYIVEDSDSFTVTTIVDDSTTLSVEIVME